MIVPRLVTNCAKTILLSFFVNFSLHAEKMYRYNVMLSVYANNKGSLWGAFIKNSSCYVLLIYRRLMERLVS